MDNHPPTQDILIERTQYIQMASKEQDKGRNRILRKLVFVLLLAGLFMTIEIIGGILSNSIAILSDAAHMLSDLLGFLISIISVYISELPANKKHSYGFHRAGVLGALASVMVIWALTIFLVFFAIQRMMNIDDIEVEGTLMLGVACFGLCTNIIMIKVLHHGKGHEHGNSQTHQQESCKSEKKNIQEDLEYQSETNDESHRKHQGKLSDKDNLNVRATLIHIFGDILQSIGVLIASILIWIDPSLKIADPVITLVFALIVFYTTIKIVKDCLFVLMEGTPAEFDVESFENELKNTKGVIGVHDLHVWSLGVGKTALSIHIDTEEKNMPILSQLISLSKLYGAKHATIQIESKDKLKSFNLDCETSLH